MMSQMLNIARREAQRVMSLFSGPKSGIVTSYDPSNYAAKVAIQPEGVETGWLPIRTPWAGNGWGIFCPPSPGDEVEIQHQEGGKQAPYVALRAFGDRFRPLPVQSGEFWLVHKSGSFLKFLNDGTVELSAQAAINSTAPIWNHTGDFTVVGEIRATGDIYDRYLSGGYTMASFRATYDIHTHAGIMAGGSHTAIPDQIL